MLTGTLLYAGSLARNAVTIWIAFFAIRWKYELDYKLDHVAKVVRWATISLGFAIALLPGAKLGIIRLLFGAVFMAFLAWPNLAYHLTRFLRRCRLLHSPDVGDPPATIPQ